MIEHNLLSAGKLGKNISSDELASLLDISPHKDDDNVNAFINKASFTSSIGRNEVFNLQYKLCCARTLDMRGEFLAAALCYYDISLIEKRQIGDEEFEAAVEQALTDAVTCTILAGAGTQRSQILETLDKDERVSKLKIYPILQNVWLERILTKQEIDAFVEELKPHQKALLLPDECTVLDKAMIEHNLLSAGKLGKNISSDKLASLLGISPCKGLIPCTSDSFDFLNMPPYDTWRSTSFLDITVAVIDSNRRVDQRVSKEDELKFLGASCGLVDYRFMGDRCSLCLKKDLHPDPNTQSIISGHGYFCASIIVSRRIASAAIHDVKLGPLRGLHIPPKLALYPIGCPLCQTLEEDADVDAISAAIERKVKVISMSIACHVPFYCYELEPKSRVREFKLIDALEHDIVTVLPAGNNGRNGLGSMAISGPWSLTVGSCCSRKKYGVRVEFLSQHGMSLHETEVDTVNVIRADQHPTVVRLVGAKVMKGRCSMYLKDDLFLFGHSNERTPPPSGYPIVHFPSEESVTISNLLLDAASRNVRIYAKLTASERKEITESPSVSDFSGKGPCEIFKYFMKPDVCAPGEEIAASWPKDEPLGGFGPPLHADYNIMNGTSFAVPHVAAVVATVRARNPDFSATATISAVITSAKRMTGDTQYREFAYGAGIVDLNGALKPGLVYEETAANYRRWFDSLLNYNIDLLSHCSLNLAYLSSPVPVGPWDCTFHRRAKSVESGPCSYLGLLTVSFTDLQSRKTQIKASICPHRLEFKNYGDVKDFTVKITLPPTLETGMLSANLTWTNDKTGQIVRSPVLLSRLNF